MFWQIEDPKVTQQEFCESLDCVKKGLTLRGVVCKEDTTCTIKIIPAEGEEDIYHSLTICYCLLYVHCMHISDKSVKYGLYSNGLLMEHLSYLVS